MFATALITFFILAFVMLAIAWPLMVIIHELGHAIPALLFTKDPVTICIGSFGDFKESKKLSFGRLNIYFKNNPFMWIRGACSSNLDNISTVKIAIIYASGTVFSLLVAIVLCYFAFKFISNGFIKLAGVIFMGASVLGFISSFIPWKHRIKVNNGETTYNDGRLIIDLFFYKNARMQVAAIVNFFRTGKYEDAAQKLETLLSTGYEEENIYRVGIYLYLKMKKFEKADEILKKFEAAFQKDSNDYFNYAMTLSKQDDHIEAIKYYTKSLEINPENSTSLNNRGFSYNLQGKYPEAIKDFDKAIELKPTFAYSYNNRGLAKIKLGKIEEGLADIQYSLKLDDKNAYSYRNLGIYHFDKGEFQEALKLFLKAKELDAETYQIDKDIKEAELALKNSLEK
jgi:tetratricopeptide (TPR) repeat protein